ncbi:hypothetical protein EZV62_003394 [Acer yangbiense]|uniref:Uncharacterized protein n=1 Tax=Acer yangbiense TaxID=1000413 RepID=A0A5C7IHD2_9ROSI|nr:hypothetical protein EZV62_003394 [Acer yangbiense]
MCRTAPKANNNNNKAAYIAVMRNSSTTNRNGFEALLKLYREVDGMQERTDFTFYAICFDITQNICLASPPDPDIVVEVLNFLVSDEVRHQDIIYGLVGLSLEGRETAWKWLKLSSNEKAEEVKAFFASQENPAIDKHVKQSIEHILIKARWIQSIRQEQSLPDLISKLLNKE